MLLPSDFISDFGIPYPSFISSVIGEAAVGLFFDKCKAEGFKGNSNWKLLHSNN